MKPALRRGAGALMAVAATAIGLLVLAPFGLARLVADLWVSVMGVVMGILGGVVGR